MMRFYREGDSKDSKDSVSSFNNVSQSRYYIKPFNKQKMIKKWIRVCIKLINLLNFHLYQM